MDSEQSSLIKYHIILIFSWARGKLVLFFFIVEYSVHKLADNEI